MRKQILLLAAVLTALVSLAQCATTTGTKATARVARMWRGEVVATRADEYERYLKAEGVAKLRSIPGNLGVETFRRNVGEREEFVVISYWPDEDTIRAYAGEDVTRARLMPRDPEFLIEPEPRVRHYAIR